MGIGSQAQATMPVSILSSCAAAGTPGPARRHRDMSTTSPGRAAGYRGVLGALVCGLALALALAAPAPAAAAQAPPGQEVDPAGADDSAPADDTLVPPRLLEDVQPVYPPDAQAKGIAAVVVVELEIGADGRVQEVTVTQPAQARDYGFDEAAVAAARGLVFEPARVGGEAVPVRLDYRFGFEAPQPPAVEVEPVETPPAVRGTSQLHGTLRERGTRLPLVGVKVTIFRGSGPDAEGFETETDAQGNFRFGQLIADDWRILAEPEGYYPVRETERLEAKKRTTARYFIERRSYNPYDVVVDTKRVRREVSRTSISAERAARIPGTFGDVLGVVQNFPGVARTPANQLVVRGSAPEDSKFFLSGSRVPLLYHFSNLRSIMPAGMVERVNFYSGNFSVEYGRVTGGVVDIDIKQLAPKKIGGHVDVSVFDAAGYLEAPIGKKLAVAVSARRSYFDAFLGASQNKRVVQPRYFDVHGLVSYRPRAAHHLQSLWLFSGDRRELYSAERPDTPEDLNIIRFLRGVTEYHYVPNDKFDNELEISFGRDTENSEINVSFDETDPFNRSTRYQMQLRESARYRFVDAFALRGGVDVLFEHVDRSVRDLPAIREGQGQVTDPDEGSIDVDTDVDPQPLLTSNSVGANYSTAGFIEIEARPHSSLLLVPGVRFDHFSRTESFAVSPRFTARQSIGERWAIKGGVGLFVQEPPFDETDRAFGNPQLGLEKAVHYSVGAEYMPRPHINLGITGFYKSMYDLVSAVDTSSVDDDGSPLLTNGGSGRAMGLEFTAQHEFSNNLYAQASYTLSRSERVDDGQPGRRRFDHDQPHVFTLIGSYRLPRNWEIGLRFRYASGNLYTPINGSFYDADAEEYRAVSGSVNTARHPDFHQLDVRIDKRWIYKRWMLNAYLDVQNLYNRREEAYDYNFDFSRRSATKVGLPILPILGLKAEF